MHVDDILNQARQSIGKYCMEECHAYCCRKGYLVMSQKEKEAVVINPDAPVRPIGDKFSLYMGNAPCPRLKDNMCTIFSHPDRPRICLDFPILHRNRIIFFSRRCLAVREGKFYPYMHELKKAGFQIVEGDEITDTEFWKLLSPEG